MESAAADLVASLLIEVQFLRGLLQLSFGLGDSLASASLDERMLAWAVMCLTVLKA